MNELQKYAKSKNSIIKTKHHFAWSPLNACSQQVKSIGTESRPVGEFRKEGVLVNGQGFIEDTVSVPKLDFNDSMSSVNVLKIILNE